MAMFLAFGLVAVHEGGYNVTTLPSIDRAIVAGLGGFDVPLDDLYVPAEASAPGFALRQQAMPVILLCRAMIDEAVD